ncbi:MAG: hypothetical protein IID09_07895 [Candidatus Hydrogenedentes bacterium]|nr:hypothetical protein [Candidatus Hydrogenedentota bacterium]
MGAIKRAWDWMWGALDKWIIIQVLLFGGGGGMTSWFQSGAELPLAYWLPNGFMVAAVLWLLWDRFDFPTGTVEVEPRRGQGPAVNWKKASRKAMSEHVVSNLHVNARDIFKKRSRVARGKKQRFENCFINGPLLTTA